VVVATRPHPRPLPRYRGIGLNTSFRGRGGVANRGKRFVAVTAPDWATAKALLDGAVDKKATASGDAAFAATRKQLPAEAGTITLFDAVKGLSFVGEYLKGLGGAIPGLPVDLPKIGKVNGDPAYLGFAVGLNGDAARVDVFVPVGAVKLVRQAFGDQ